MPRPLPLVVSLLALSLLPAAAARAAEAASASWMVDFDNAWAERDDPQTARQLITMAQWAARQEPDSFEANWRLAAAYNWEANNKPDGSAEKAGLGKQGWEAADIARAKKPGDVRGHYHAAVGIGLYSEGVGILTALSQGLEGKFKERAEAALRIDNAFLDGAPQALWGRFFFKLPWPKRDRERSIAVLTEAVKSHPNNLRAKYYLAASLLDDGKKAEAKKQAEDVAAAPVGKDAPEDKKVKAELDAWRKAHAGDF